MVASVQKVYGRRRSLSDRNAISANFISQTHFPPVRRTAKAKGSAWSAPSKRQKTITQMNPFHQIYHPEEHEEILQYLDDVTGNYQESPKRAKRRKISEDDTPTQPARTRLTRSAAAKATAHSVTKIETDDKPLKDVPVNEQRGFQDSKMMPPPPKTPRSRRTEIPSSQSPVATPLSTRSSGRFRQDATRSPLSERSLNTLIRLHSPAKESGGGRPFREIADSMEDEGDSVISASRAGGSSMRTQSSAENSYESFSALPTLTTEPHEKTVGTRINENMSQMNPFTQVQQPFKHGPASIKVYKRVEVLDSDAEDESDEDISTSHCNKDIFQGHRPTPNVDDDLKTQPATARLSAISSSNTSRSSPQILKTLRTSQGQPTIDVPSSQPEPNNTTPPHLKSPPNSPYQLSVEVPSSARRHRSLLHSNHTQNQAGLTSESQYDNGWKSYHPPLSTALPPSSSALQPISSPKSFKDANYNDDNTPITIPTQPLPRSRTVPPSQATTVDTTQPSQIISSSPILEPSTPPPPPAPPALSSSSPMLCRRGMSQGGDKAPEYVWDGRVLTDSQLLPASLMEDSFGEVGDDLEVVGE